MIPWTCGTGYGLEDSALAMLRAKRAGPDAPGRCLFFILIHPAFEPVECWGVYRGRRDSSYHCVSFFRWRRDVDSIRLEEAKENTTLIRPTIESKTVELSEELAKDLLKSLRRVSVKPVVRDGLWVDATVYEVTMGHLFDTCTFRWCHEPPPEWEALGKAVHKVLVRLREALQQAQPPTD